MIRTAIAVTLLASVLGQQAGAVSFNRVVALGDSLTDDESGGDRSPVAAEQVAAALDAPITILAQSGSQSSDLIAQGQHTTATATHGPGDLALLWIGGNDFLQNYLQVSFGLYGGIMNTLEANVDTAINTLQSAGMDVVAFNLPDLSDVPITLGLTNFRAATVEWNSRLDNLAAQYGVPVVDVYSLFEEINADPTQFDLYGHTPELSFGLVSECPLCVFADPIHPSSYAAAYIANEAIGTINEAYDPQGLDPVREISIVDIALLADVYAGDLNGDDAVTGQDFDAWQTGFGTTSGATHAGGDADLDSDADLADLMVLQRQFGLGASAIAAVPEPGGLVFAGAAAVALLGARRRG